MSDLTQQVIDEFRANHGRVGGPFEGEWDELWEQILEKAPGLGDYQRRTDRVIPLVRLTRAA